MEFKCAELLRSSLLETLRAYKCGLSTGDSLSPQQLSANDGNEVLLPSGHRIPRVVNGGLSAHSNFSHRGNFEMRMDGNFQARRGGRFGMRIGGNVSANTHFAKALPNMTFTYIAINCKNGAHEISASPARANEYRSTENI